MRDIGTGNTRTIPVFMYSDKRGTICSDTSARCEIKFGSMGAELKKGDDAIMNLCKDKSLYRQIFIKTNLYGKTNLYEKTWRNHEYLSRQIFMERHNPIMNLYEDKSSLKDITQS